MANDVMIYNTTAITPTITNTTLAAASCAQAATLDFGTPRAANFLVRASAQWTANPTAGTTLDVYIGWSSASNAGQPGGVGSAAATTIATTVLANLEFVGSLVLNAVTTYQTMDIGVVMPKLQYGTFVWYNGASISMGSATTLAISCTPIVDQVQ